MWDKKWDNWLGLVKMGNWPESNNYECELVESDYLPSISLKKFWVGWIEGELSRQESLRLEIRNGTCETWKGAFGLGLVKMGNWPESNSYECELMESDYLPFISFEKFLVGGWVVVQWDYSVSSAPFLSELRLWELSREIWAEKSRSRAWQFLCFQCKMKFFRRCGPRRPDVHKVLIFQPA